MRINRQRLKDIIIGFFSGGIIIILLQLFIVPFIQEHIRLFVTRPKISTKIQSIILSENENGEWELTSHLKFANSGDRSISLNINSLEVFFPELSYRPYNFVINKSIEIPNNRFIYDTVNYAFPYDFKLVSNKRIPKLKRVRLNLDQQNGRKLTSVIVDTLDIIYNFYHGWEYREDIKLEGEIFDSSLTEHKLIAKRCYINYKGKEYLNHVYPENAQVKYNIKNDKIFLECKLGGYDLQSGSELIIEPFKFFPHKELSDKIVIPDGVGLDIFIERRKKDRIDYEYYNIYLGLDKKQIVYIFK